MLRLKELLLPGLMVLFLVLAWTTEREAERTLCAALSVLFGAYGSRHFATPHQQANEHE
jgi:hypothetical protein